MSLSTVHTGVCALARIHARTHAHARAHAHTAARTNASVRASVHAHTHSLSLALTHVLAYPAYPAYLNRTDITLGEPEAWYVFVDTLINGNVVPHPWSIGKEDVFQVVICMCVCIYVYIYTLAKRMFSS